MIRFLCFELLFLKIIKKSFFILKSGFFNEKTLKESGNIS